MTESVAPQGVLPDHAIRALIETGGIAAERPYDGRPGATG